MKSGNGIARNSNAVFRIGSVSYLNAKPLIYGLETQPDLQLDLDVPSGLLTKLRDGQTDVALLPVIDYQRLNNARIIPSGGIGCDGPTLTVRIFSPIPINQITSLACDMDSHTSVALARIILAEQYNLHPCFVDLNSANAPLDEPGAASNAAEARLLIGDKVVCQEPQGMQHQLDLGAAWKDLTGNPFVFAVWTARGDVDLRDLPARLQNARVAGMAHLHEIVARDALPRGWPAALALQYMTHYLKYEIGTAQLNAIQQFHHLAARHGIIPSPVKHLNVYG